MADRHPPRRRRPVGAADPAGTATRRAALRLIDAILRRGDPLDVAMHAAAQGLGGADRAFAIAIASETLRWMVDIDALIDGATAQILPDDVKSRAVLRIALAQLLVLKSPGHAVVSTAFPLVHGGPRRAVRRSNRCPSMAKAAGGCRIWRQACRRACSVRARAAPRSTCARPPAARRCNSRRRAGMSSRSTPAQSGWSGCAPIWSGPACRRISSRAIYGPGRLPSLPMR